MAEDNAKDLTTGEKLDLILSRIAELEAQTEDRSNTTRPLIERAIHEMIQTREILIERMDRVEARLSTLEGETKTIRREIGLLREDIRNERLARIELAERVSDLEKRPS